MTTKRLSSNQRYLTIGWKLSASAIGVTVLVLFLAIGAVSVRLWREAADQGDRALAEAALSTSGLLQVYDDTARQAAQRDFGIFKAPFDTEFVLADGPAREGKPQPLLSNRGKPLNGDFEIVDRVTRLTGAAATVFARTGDDFLRITTSLTKADGSRAMGTLLDRKHPAYPLMLEGKTFTGRATLFGKPYMTYYEPIREGGRVIGILFVGSDMRGTIEGVRQTMAAQHPLYAGSVFAVDLKEGATLGDVYGLDHAFKVSGADDPLSLLGHVRSGAERDLLDGEWAPGGPGSESPASRFAYVRNPAWNWAVVAQAPRAEMFAPVRQDLAMLWGASLVAVVVLLAMITWLTRRLVGRPIAGLVESLSGLAQGDLSRPVRSQRNDEIGRLSESMERFRTQLAATLGAVRENARSVVSASDLIAAGSRELSARTESQSAALQQTSATMDELSQTVRANADGAQRANTLALGASEVATKGGGVVDQVVRTMRDISDGSKTIAEIISVIDGIAFQTNILALNAAVEAARAGDQGRGFAVVAAEVRNLAQRSAEAAKQIKALITGSVDQVQLGARLVDEAGRTMVEIVGAIGNVREIVGKISAANSEQSAGVLQVGRAVAQIDQSTQQNANVVEQSAASAQRLKEQADELARAVSAFRLEAQAA